MQLRISALLGLTHLLDYTMPGIKRELKSWNEDNGKDKLAYIEEKRLLTWSPEQIACSVSPYRMPSWRTIYRWLYDKYLLDGKLKVLGFNSAQSLWERELANCCT